MKLLSKIVFFFFFLTLSFASHAQEEDSSRVVKILKKEIDLNFSRPEKAGIYSAVLPGLGQAYNKKYWKIPVIYLLGGATGYMVGYYHGGYKICRDVVINWDDENPVSMEVNGYPLSTEGGFRTHRDDMREMRDYFILATSIVYLLNVVDAVVDAHFSTFDISDDLSLNFKPDIQFYNQQKWVPLMGLSINFK